MKLRGRLTVYDNLKQLKILITILIQERMTLLKIKGFPRLTLDTEDEKERSFFLTATSLCLYKAVTNCSLAAFLPFTSLILPVVY